MRKLIREFVTSLCLEGNGQGEVFPGPREMEPWKGDVHLELWPWRQRHCWNQARKKAGVLEIGSLMCSSPILCLLWVENKQS